MSGWNNGKVITVSRKLAKILTVSRKSHHPIENLFIPFPIPWGVITSKRSTEIIT